MHATLHTMSPNVRRVEVNVDGEPVKSWEPTRVSGITTYLHRPTSELADTGKGHPLDQARGSQVYWSETAREQ
jgi:hypothetical protein